MKKLDPETITLTVIDRGTPARARYGDEDNWLLETQDRIIIRLRAALRTLGKTTEEIDAIVRDCDGEL